MTKQNKLISDEQMERASMIIMMAQQNNGTVFKKQALTHALYNELILTEIKGLRRDIQQLSAARVEIARSGDTAVVSRKRKRRTNAEIAADKLKEAK